MSLDLDTFLSQCRQRCDHRIAQHLQSLPAMPARLTEAMRYSTLLGGKRIRPCLVYASALALNNTPGGTLTATNSTMAATDAAACAVELMHCYSLIHDDLPAMDNDDLRRGQPTLHKAFDEATAILAGDALQSLSLQVLCEQPQLRPDLALRMVTLLTHAGGCAGMIAGQGIDLESVGKALTLTQLENMHRLKTGALISASVELGALSAGCDDEQVLTALRHYAACIGLAFQVQDDILDVVSDTGTLGKTQGADQALNKPTYVSLLGLESARAKARELVAEACSALQTIDGDTTMLEAIASFITNRSH